MILIACEWSGITVNAFEKKGHQVYSCDIKEANHSGMHHQGDIRNIINARKWDLIIGYPPIGDKELVDLIANADAHAIAIENPSSFLPKDGVRQILKPYPGMRCSALWLKNLSPLLERPRKSEIIYRFKPVDQPELTDEWLAESMAKTWG